MGWKPGRHEKSVGLKQEAVQGEAGSSHSPTAQWNPRGSEVLWVGLEVMATKPQRTKAVLRERSSKECGRTERAKCVVQGIRYSALDQLKLSEKLTDVKGGFLSSLKFCLLIP